MGYGAGQRRRTVEVPQDGVWRGPWLAFSPSAGGGSPSRPGAAPRTRIPLPYANSADQTTRVRRFTWRPLAEHDVFFEFRINTLLPPPRWKTCRPPPPTPRCPPRPKRGRLTSRRPRPRATLPGSGACFGPGCWCCPPVSKRRPPTWRKARQLCGVFRRVGLLRNG